MTWDEFKVGDLVEQSDDYLYVVAAQPRVVTFILVSKCSSVDTAANGGVEVWDGSLDDGGYSWDNVLKQTTLVSRLEKK